MLLMLAYAIATSVAISQTVPGTLFQAFFPQPQGDEVPLHLGWHLRVGAHICP